MSPHAALDRVGRSHRGTVPAQRRIVRLDAQQHGAPAPGLMLGHCSADIGAAGLRTVAIVHQRGPARVTETIEILLDASGEPPALRQRAGTDLFAVPSARRASPPNIVKRPAMTGSNAILRVRTKTCPNRASPSCHCGEYPTDRQMTAMRQEWSGQGHPSRRGGLHQLRKNDRMATGGLQPKFHQCGGYRRRASPQGAHRSLVGRRAWSSGLSRAGGNGNVPGRRPTP